MNTLAGLGPLGVDPDARLPSAGAGQSLARTSIPVGYEADFPPGKFVMVEAAGRDIGVIRLKTGEFRAVRNRCPHKAAPICRGIVGGTWPPSGPGNLSFDRDGEILVCPWHGWEYDLGTGEALFQTSSTRLLMYPVTVENGQVYITVATRRDP